MCKRHFFYLTAACLLFAFIYSPTRLYFLSDDFDSLLFSLHPEHIFQSFRPLSDASLYLDYSLWKMNAAGFHLTNLILHFLSVFCFYFFSKFLFLLRNNLASSANMALAASLLFLFYPFHSEALFWIVGRGAVLCTLFGLLSFIFYCKKEENRLYYLLSVVCFAASLLSYEEAWIIPVLITLFSLLTTPKSKRISLLYSFGFWLIFLIYLTGRFYFTKDVIGTPYGSERMVGFTISLLCKNFAALIFRSIVIPMQSSVAFSITCAIITVVLVVLIVIVRKKINRVLYISATFFLLSLLPVLPLGIDTHDTESERFLYFPSVFLLIFLVQFFYFVFEKNQWIAFAIFIAEGVVLWQSYNSFVLSSSICRTTISALIKTSNTDTLFCSQLPDQYKGAFIFRNGFESAVKLIKKDSVKPVIILSRSELFHPEKNYTSSFQSMSQGKKIINGIAKSNVYMEWTESKLIIKK